MDRSGARRRGALALGVALALAGCGAHATTLGVALPFAGRDGARGLAARAAIELAVEREREGGAHITLVVVDTAQHIQNPHEDEGTDDAETPERAADAVRALAAGGATIVAGALRPAIAAAMLRAASAAHVEFVPLDCPAPRDPFNDAALSARFRSATGFAPTGDAASAYAATAAALEATPASAPARLAFSTTCRAVGRAGTGR